MVTNISSTLINGKIEADALFEDYKQACACANVQFLAKNLFSRVVLQIFPHSKQSRIRNGSERKHVYIGIDKTISSTPSSNFLPSEIRNHLDTESVLLSNSEVYARIGVLSNITANGNHVIKEITLNFITKIWTLKVRGITVNLDTLGLSRNFDLTVQSWKNILYVVKLIRLCKGLIVTDKKTIPLHITSEVIQDNNEEDSYRFMRCSTCFGVISWLCTGTACIHCRKLLNPFKNTDQSKLINLGENIDRDLSTVFDNVFPGASPEMKMFLTSQREALQAAGARRRRWDQKVIKVCLSLWSRSPRTFCDIKDSNMFILPSGGLLQRYKNFVPQNSGVNIELFRWMLNTAKKMKLPLSGYHGGLVHDETKIQEDLVINTKGCENQLVGWVDTGDEGESLKILKEKTVNKTLATEVLQVSFLGYTGFRYVHLIHI